MIISSEKKGDIPELSDRVILNRYSRLVPIISIGQEKFHISLTKRQINNFPFNSITTTNYPELISTPINMRCFRVFKNINILSKIAPEAEGNVKVTVREVLSQIPKKFFKKACFFEIISENFFAGAPCYVEEFDAGFNVITIRLYTQYWYSEDEIDNMFNYLKSEHGFDIFPRDLLELKQFVNQEHCQLVIDTEKYCVSGICPYRVCEKDLIVQDGMIFSITKREFFEKDVPYIWLHYTTVNSRNIPVYTIYCCKAR